MRDPYTVLGLQKSASTADIKKAYRRLAKEYHPDQSRDPKAKDRFAEVGSAYEILGDEKKRGSFDRGEIDADGKPKFHGFEGFSSGGRGGGGRGGFQDFEFNFGGGRGGRSSAGGFDASDIFSDLFGGGGAARGGRSGGFGQQPPPLRGEDVQASVTVTLAESTHGATKRVTLPSGRTLDVSVPAGIEDGKQIRLKAQGQSGARGGTTGDAIVTVHVARHPFFRVEGRDLRLDLPITLYEAVLGGKVNVPTLEGQVEMGIPAGSNGSRTLRLRGKGLAGPGGGARGDLLVALRIVLPDEAEGDLVETAKKMAAHPYDPRKALG